MSQERRIINNATQEEVLAHGKWCVSLWCHFKGLMFRRNLAPSTGLIFVRKSDSIVNTSIHMFFCFFPIGVVWVNGEMEVVDAKLAKPWRPYYASKAPARYFIEAKPDILERVTIGDKLRFDTI